MLLDADCDDLDVDDTMDSIKTDENLETDSVDTSDTDVSGDETMEFPEWYTIYSD